MAIQTKAKQYCMDGIFLKYCLYSAFFFLSNFFHDFFPSQKEIVDAKKQKSIHYVLSSQDVNFGYLLTRRYTKENYIAQLKNANIEIDELEPSTL